MIEMPEATVLARQMQPTLAGKTVSRFSRGPLTHKFLWLNRPEGEYQSMLSGRKVTGAGSFGRSIYLYLGEVMLWWGDAGGSLRFFEPGASLPQKYHLSWEFSDGSCLIYTLQMWGAVKLLDRSQFRVLPNEESGIEPLSPGFSPAVFQEMLDAYPEKTSKGIKGFLVATGYAASRHINGLGNAYVQDILFQAGLDPRRKIMHIGAPERHNLYEAIQTTIAQATEQGGREEESDLFGQHGRYIRRMDSRTAGTPCPRCQTLIQKITYLGGSCYLCPGCQV